MQTRDIDYAADGAILRGFLALNQSAGRVPGVLVFHEGLGLGDFEMEKARQLASLGYGRARRRHVRRAAAAKSLQEVATIVGGLRAEPERLLTRAQAALATLAGLPQVDASRLAAIGFLLGRTAF
jgi:dienelactone hydrolase